MKLVTSTGILVQWLIVLPTALGSTNGIHARKALESTATSEGSRTICVYLADGVYETRRHIPEAQALADMTTGLALDQSCVCSNLCLGAVDFDVQGDRCSCLFADSTLNLHYPRRRNLDGTDDFFREGPDLVTCAVGSTCNQDVTCPSYTQRCVSNTTTLACTCEPIRCANRYGNPCGPAGICTDTPTGYTCTKFNLPGCGAGCGRHSVCNVTPTPPQCECLPGYNRTAPHLACQSTTPLVILSATPKTILRNVAVNLTITVDLSSQPFRPTIELYQVYVMDMTGFVDPEALGILYDVGSGNGTDTVAGDGIYSNAFYVQPQPLGGVAIGYEVVPYSLGLIVPNMTFAVANETIVE